MLPPLSDLMALLCINLVLSAAFVRLLMWRYGSRPWILYGVAVFFVVLWCPVGSAELPLVAYARGISSDLSISLTVIACLGMYKRLSGKPLGAVREYRAVSSAVAVAALFVYPLALGVGDWDPYRLGWGEPGLWLALLGVSLVCWVNGLRLLPALIALALLTWSANLLESTNLWDYLIDPWLAVGAIYQSLSLARATLRDRWRAARAGHKEPSTSA